MATVTRIDTAITSGGENPKDWTLLRNDGTWDITNDTVYMYISKKRNTQYSIKLSSLPGAHQDNAHSKVRFRISIPAQTQTEIWWYEIWVLPDGETYARRQVVGELMVYGTNKG